MKKDYRIHVRALKLDDDALAGAVVEPIWLLPTASVRQEHLPRVWKDVTHGQLLVYAVTWVEREVNNGGFWQYFYNTSADLPMTALEGLREMGAGDYARLLKRAIRVFPDGRRPATRSQRMRCLPEDPYEKDLSAQHRKIVDALDKLTDKFFDLYGDGKKYYRLMARFIRAHPSEFFSDASLKENR